tara:strand:+ start:743 stop:1603 length:861 start_codon:yes stop_codon:yes gene_type:complete
MKKKVIIIYEKSNKIGFGHYSRSLRLKKKLLNKFKIKLYEFKDVKYLIKKITKDKYNLHIFDLKNYPKKIEQLKNIIIFEDIKKKFKDIISINPLDLNLKNSGPKYFLYPESFIKNKKFDYSKKKLNILIVQGRNDSNNQLKKIVNFLITNVDKLKFNFKINIKVKDEFKDKNSKLIKNLPNFKDEFEIYKDIDFAISGVGNTSFELGFFGIPTIHYSVEKREIIRAKIFQKLKLAPYIKAEKLHLIIKELNKLYMDDNYRKKIINRRIKFFRKENYIEKIINEII